MEIKPYNEPNSRVEAPSVGLRVVLCGPECRGAFGIFEWLGNVSQDETVRIDVSHALVLGCFAVSGLPSMADTR